jgi:uncharacterized protein
MNDGFTPITRILWRSDEDGSAERFSGRATAEGWRLEGVVVLPIEGEPAEIRYHVDLDPGWRTRQAEVAIAMHTGHRTIAFATDGDGSWKVDGALTEPLDGCIDVDFGFTPATNTLQIRRLGLEVGESRTLPVAWLAFPALTVQPVVQTYTRLDADRWRYGDEDFTADLIVDPDGYVLRYGDDIWQATAHRTAA